MSLGWLVKTVDLNGFRLKVSVQFNKVVLSKVVVLSDSLNNYYGLQCDNFAIVTITILHLQ